MQEGYDYRNAECEWRALVKAQHKVGFVENGRGVTSGCDLNIRHIYLDSNNELNTRTNAVFNGLAAEPKHLKFR